MYINVKDDVGMIFHDILSIFEQQSSFCPNMPFRGLGYIANSLREYIAQTYEDPSVMYSSRLIHIPVPRYYVFYNGTSEQPEEQILRLSDAYDGDGDVDVTAHMLNINKGHNRKLLDACKPLAEYAELVSRVRIFRDDGLSNEEAVKEAVNSCIADGILAGILRREMAKVVDILIAGLDDEQRKKLAEIEKNYAVEDATKSIRKELEVTSKELEETNKELEETKAALDNSEKERMLERCETVNRIMSNMGVSLEKACELAGVSVEEYKDQK